MNLAIAEYPGEAALSHVSPVELIFSHLSAACCAQVSMNEMMETIKTFEGKKLPIRHIPGPEGVRGRNSDNALILEKLGWEPTIRLADGLKVTYFWIKSQLDEVSARNVCLHFKLHLICHLAAWSPRRSLLYRCGHLQEPFPLTERIAACSLSATSLAALALQHSHVATVSSLLPLLFSTSVLPCL